MYLNIGTMVKEFDIQTNGSVTKLLGAYYDRLARRDYETAKSLLREPVVQAQLSPDRLRQEFGKSGLRDEGEAFLRERPDLKPFRTSQEAESFRAQIRSLNGKAPEQTIFPKI